MNDGGSSEQTSPGSDDHLKGTKVVLNEQDQQESSGFLPSSAVGSGEKYPAVPHVFPNESSEIFSCGKDVLLFCRVNPKEPFVFMGRSHTLSPFPLSLPFCPS
jgi:hypothetical protein